MFRLPHYPNLGNVTTILTMYDYTRYACCIVLTSTHVPTILQRCSVPQITQSVIRGVTVYMIDYFW